MKRTWSGIVVNFVRKDPVEGSSYSSNELYQYLNCRYISACAGSWHIFGFPIHHRHPSVERLSFHLLNQQYIVYDDSDDVSELIEKPWVCESQFLGWMSSNQIDLEARKLTYSQFPNKYVYNKSKRKWKKRKRRFSIGRMTHVSISTGELYYLHVLLTHVKGPYMFWWH